LYGRASFAPTSQLRISRARGSTSQVARGEKRKNREYPLVHVVIEGVEPE
jgi:hypothetical protein